MPCKCHLKLAWIGFRSLSKSFWSNLCFSPNTIAPFCWTFIYNAPKNILNNVPIHDSTKIFFTSKLWSLTSSNPTHQIETRIANRWETTNSNPLGPIKLFNQFLKQKQLITTIWLCWLNYSKSPLELWKLCSLNMWH